jgi:hypothetical protein
MAENSTPIPPKSSPDDPPAANRPTGEGEGSPPPKPPEPADAAGRDANDPSMTRTGGVVEAPQVPAGKPDGEVDTRA